ncbi:MAG: hypothetical protein IJH34_10940, partial [Romboutsia sp.]|nr:hypothetical protein [Romboutsia sp.]
VEVNDKREYIITETIDVYFNEYRHGLLRNIPFKSTTDNYKIKDIYVDGDKFSISSENPNVQIKIGDENEMIQVIRNILLNTL